MTATPTQPAPLDDAGAMALLDAEIASCGRLEPEDCENCARIRTARAHLAARLAELEASVAERDRWLALLERKEQDALGRATRAEAELAAVREDAALLSWLADEWDKNGVISATRYATGTAGCGLFTISSQHVRGYGLRAAIDAARGDG